MLRFVGEIDQIGHRRLHPIGQFVLLDARVIFGIGIVVKLFLIQTGKIVQHPTPAGGIESIGVAQKHRVANTHQFDAVTIMAWIQINRLDHALQAVFHTRDWEAGSGFD